MTSVLWRNRQRIDQTYPKFDERVISDSYTAVAHDKNSDQEHPQTFHEFFFCPVVLIAVTTNKYTRTSFNY